MRTKEKCLPAKPRRERDRSEGAANDLGSLRIGLTTSLRAGKQTEFLTRMVCQKKSFLLKLTVGHFPVEGFRITVSISYRSEKSKQVFT